MEQDMGKENEVNYPVEDLTDKSFEEISEILKGEQEAGRLFHGSNASAPYEELRVNKADDIHRESGRKTAVYAADQPEEALHRAVVNRQFFGDNLRSYTIGWSQKEGKFVMTADPSAYTLLMNERDECFSDGYIYILDRNGFEQSPDSSHEFAAEKNQTPIKAYKVPGHVVADAMFQIDNGTIVQYSKEEMERINKHVEEMDKARRTKEDFEGH